MFISVLFIGYAIALGFPEIFCAPLFILFIEFVFGRFVPDILPKLIYSLFEFLK